MPRIKLTQHVLDKRLRAPTAAGKQTPYWDESLPGFGVICSGVSRTKSYVVQRDLPGGKTRRVTVASASEMKLDEARERAKKLLIEMREGRDPKHRSAASATLRETLDAYLAKNKNLAARSVEIYRHLVLRHLEPWLDRALASITPTEVDEMHDRIAATVAKKTGGQNSGATVANDAMRALRLLWNWAARRDDGMGRNPVRLRKSEWHEQDPVRRPIPSERLADWYRAVTQLPPNGRDWLLLMLFTGMRRRESAALRWKENIDFDKRTITLPGASTKSGRALDIPMSDFVRDMLVARRALGDAKFVFPSYGDSGHVEDPRAFIDAVRKATGIEFSSHDLRRTFITVAESCDISAFALKALVNHSIGTGVTEGYIKMGVERLREPAQRVASRLKLLCKITTPGGENVTRLG
jgi:integrase